jgi:hypothetical protein
VTPSTLDKESGYVLMSAAKPVAFSLNEDALRLAALRLYRPQRNYPVITWTISGKLFIRRGFHWCWTGIEVLRVNMIGE